MKIAQPILSYNLQKVSFTISDSLVPCMIKGCTKFTCCVNGSNRKVVCAEHFIIFYELYLEEDTVVDNYTKGWSKAVNAAWPHFLKDFNTERKKRY